MARLLIAYTPNGIRVLRNVRTDDTSDPLILLDEGETKVVTIDMTAYLDSGETISSVTSTQQSVTASVSTATPIITITLSGATSYADGTVTFVITLSSGEIIRQQIHVRRPNKYGLEQFRRDYA